MKFSVKTKITLGFGAAILLLLATGWLSYRATRQLTTTLDMVAHSQEVIGTLEATLASLTQIEAEQRGYLLTGADDFLEDRETATTQLQKQLERLQVLTRENPSQQSYLTQLTPMIARRLELMDERIAVFRQSGLAGVADPVVLSRGKEVMDQIRSRVGEMHEEEARLLAKRTEAAHNDSRFNLAIIGASSALAVGLGILAILRIRRDLVLRAQAEQELEKNQNLLESILDHTPALVFLKDLEGRYLFVNRRFAEVAGRSREEIKGKTAFDLAPAELAQKATEHQQTVLARQAPVEVEETVQYREGLRPHLAVKFPLRDGAGKIYATAGISTDITARKQAETERDRFFTLSLDLLCIASGDGYFKRVSPAVTDILGWSVEEFLARPYLEHVHPDDQAATQREVEKQMQSGKRVFNFENRYRHKDGAWRVLSWRSMPQGDLMYAIARDVTELKRAEEELQAAKNQLEVRVLERTAELAHVNESLRHSERRFRALLEHGGDSIALLNAENKFLYLSPAVQAVEGYAPEELLGRSGQENTHPDDLPLLQEVREKLLAQPSQPVPVLWRRRHKKGHWLWLEGVATNLLDDPAVLAVVINYRDVTARKQAEQAIRESEERYRNVTSATDDVIWEWNMEAQTLWWNENFQHTFGYRPEEIAPGLESWTDQIHAEDKERVVHSIHVAIARGEQRWSEEYRFRRADGQYAYVFDRGFVIYRSDGQPVRMIGAMVDLTERKRAEEEIRALNAELEQRVQQRTMQLEATNKELEAFSYSVSHDLRAPLRHIDGFVDLLGKQSGDKLDERGRRYLGIITGAARQMGHLIDDLLVFSRMGRVELRQQQVELDALVHEAVASMQPDLVGRNIEWQIGHLPKVTADAAMLRQVLVNLIANAVKYSRPRDPAKIEIGCATEGAPETVIFVCDNGVGFDMEYVNKLFGVFQRLHRSEDFEGTGIGLANVQRIILRHGGRVWAEGKIDAGATFYFTLPQSQKE